jgi:hypothetical protein
MSEEQNIPEGNQKGQIPDSSPEGNEQYFPEGDHTPKPETIKPQPATEQPELKDMEVHHHSHPGHQGGKKNWKSWFWEFLMLFLAVFCGFLAENFREHYIEDKRAEKLAQSLYKEILADSISVRERIAIRQIKENECGYFISYVKDSNLAVLSDRFLPAFSWAFIQSQKMFFEPNDGMLNQLRNSGELRYFKSSELKASIGRLSVMIANVRNRNEREYSFVENNLRPFSIKFYDFNWYETLVKNGDLGLHEALEQRLYVPAQGKIQNLDKFDRLEAQNIASYHLLMLRGTRKSQYMGYVKLNHELLQILRKEYHLQ